MRYYFLITYFPEIRIGDTPGITFEELKDMLNMNLTEKDLERVKDFLTLIDIRNIRANWLEEPIDPRGNLSEKEIEEALLVQEGLPPFIFEYMDRYQTKEERLRYFTDIYAKFFQYAVQEPDGFLQKYFEFERELRLILLALRAKQFQKDISIELQFEDPQDSFVMYILSQKDMEDFDPPAKYQEVKDLFLETQNNPKEMNRKFLEYRFRKIEEMEMEKIFGIDQVLGYIARLLLAEYWDQLDNNEGAALLSSIA